MRVYMCVCVCACAWDDMLFSIKLLPFAWLGFRLVDIVARFINGSIQFLVTMFS